MRQANANLGGGCLFSDFEIRGFSGGKVADLRRGGQEIAPRTEAPRHQRQAARTPQAVSQRCRMRAHLLGRRKRHCSRRCARTEAQRSPTQEQRSPTRFPRTALHRCWWKAVRPAGCLAPVAGLLVQKRATGIVHYLARWGLRGEQKRARVADSKSVKSNRAHPQQGFTVRRSLNVIAEL